jgi:serine/threonine protein kinase
MAAPATRTLGQYDLVAPLGTGGMGMVWQARHRSLRRAVAVKLLRVDRSLDPQSVERFFREMAALGQLQHSHLVQAYDAGEIDGVPYLTMEFLDGIDLHELVKKTGPLTPAEACELIRQAALGLAYAHDQQCIHRDVKPSNLFVQKNGELKVLDLGLARLLNQNRAEFAETQSCRVMGTLDYMSPEQFRNASKVDARSDVYSLGCTLFFALRGSAPFREHREEGPMAMGMAHATAPIPPLSDLPGAPAELVVRMLAKTPDERPATMAEVVSTLEPFCRGGAEQLRSRLRRYNGDSTAMQADTVNRQANAQASATSHFHKPQPSCGHRWFVLVGVAVALIGGGWQFLRRPAASLPSNSASSVPDSTFAVEPASALLPLPLVQMLISGDYAWTDPVNLGPNVNSSDEEGSPTLSADGLCLIFSRRDQKGVRVLRSWRRHGRAGAPTMRRLPTFCGISAHGICSHRVARG